MSSLRGKYLFTPLLLEADLEHHTQRLTDKHGERHLSWGMYPGYWQIQEVVDFLVSDYESAIASCDRHVLKEFFMRVKCLGEHFNCGNFPAPDAARWARRVRTIYQRQERLALTLWRIIEEQEYNRVLDDQAALAQGPRRIVYELMCLGAWFRTLAPQYQRFLRRS